MSGREKRKSSASWAPWEAHTIGGGYAARRHSSASTVEATDSERSLGTLASTGTLASSSAESGGWTADVHPHEAVAAAGAFALRVRCHENAALAHLRRGTQLLALASIASAGWLPPPGRTRAFPSAECWLEPAAPSTRKRQGDQSRAARRGRSTDARGEERGVGDPGEQADARVGRRDPAAALLRVALGGGRRSGGAPPQLAPRDADFGREMAAGRPAHDALPATPAPSDGHLTSCTPCSPPRSGATGVG